jgi:hypothetical protein
MLQWMVETVCWLETTCTLAYLLEPTVTVLMCFRRYDMGEKIILVEKKYLTENFLNLGFHGSM